MSAELIEKLDPNRDYGKRTYTDIVREVEEGTLSLHVGPTALPVIRNAADGVVVKGTGGQYLHKAQDNPRIHTKAVFLERAHSDFEKVYESMIESATKGDVRAQKLFMELYVGRPREASDAVDKAVVSRLFELALQPKEKVFDA